MNPLRRKQVELMNQIGLDDAARKINEIVERFNLLKLDRKKDEILENVTSPDWAEFEVIMDKLGYTSKGKREIKRFIERLI